MPSSKHNGTVLVVDDQERNIQVVGTTLSAMGFQVMAASNGEDALARIATRAPDVILLDIYMPDLDGFEVCARLKAAPHTSEIPIIFLSAADDTNIVVRALEAGGVDYITKPFNRAELLARVRTHVALKRARDEREKLIREREIFIGMMAHDLKNPLGGAQFSTRMLVEQEHQLPEKIMRLAKTADEGVSRALDLITNFLSDAEAANIEHKIEARPIDLAACVDRAVSHHRSYAAGKSIELNWEHPLREVTALGDADALGRVLDNLISNAIKFSPLEKRVWVELDPDQRTVTVRDEGPGFTETDRVNLFETFMRLSAKPTGDETSTGLGLSVAKRLTEAMGGEIELAEGSGNGAEFRLTLGEAAKAQESE